MSGKMELSDGTSSVGFSPLVEPGIRRPDNRTRGVHQYDSGQRQYWDAAGGFREGFSLNNISKAKADQLNKWWRGLTILQFRQDDIVIFADLDGNSQYFYRNDTDFPESGITGANDLTIQAWIKPDDPTVVDIASKYLAAGSKRMYAFTLDSSGYLSFRVSSDGTLGNLAVVTSAVAQIVNDNKWHHVAVVYDASAGTADFYRDGVFADQQSGLKTSIADKDPDFTIGKVSAQNYFDGGIYNVALFDDKRTAGEVLASAADPDEDLSGEGNIIGQWMFDEASDAAAIDNTQGDAGRDLIPYDGGDVTFGECGRTTTLIHARINPAGTRPFQWMWGQEGDTLHEAVLTIVEVSSSSSA